MKAEITLLLADGTKKEMPFLACGTTSIRYRQVFGKELMESITGVMTSLGSEGMARMITLASLKEAGKDWLEKLDPQTLSELFRIAGSGEMESIARLAFILNRQAEKADMGSLSFEDFVDWLEQFESMELIRHAMDFITLYMGNRQTSSIPKKEAAQLSEG